MTDVEIGRMNTTLEFAPEAGTSAPPPAAAADMAAADAQRLMDLLRPVILEILAEELDMHTRAGG